MASNVILKANVGQRGKAQTQPAGSYGAVQAFDLTWSWGAQAASCVIRYVSDTPIAQYASVTIVAGLHTFYGICDKQVLTNSSGGQLNELVFVDMRIFLGFDQVFGYFNRRIDLLVDGIWTKYYSHMLPGNFSSNLITYTAGPYTASQILDFIFGAPTVHAPWQRLYHVAQTTDYVYNIDCSNGRKLSDVVTQISQRQGLVFTLMGGMWQLAWALKGQGVVPLDLSDDQFPANSDNRRLGAALSEKPDSVTVVGGHNRYQVLNIPMTPDWNANILNVDQYPGYASGNPSPPWLGGFEHALTRYVFNFMTDPVSGQPYNTPIANDPEFIIGKMQAKARAETMTLGELADFIDTLTDGLGGEAFRDRRKFNGRTRLDMPVFIYVKTLIFRAYRLPDDFSIVNYVGNNLGPLQVKIIPTTLVETTYDYESGSMSYAEETAPGGNGLAIVQGFGFFTPPPETFESDRFDLSTFQNTQKLWQRVQFQIDDTGNQTQFIIFDDPVAVSRNFLTQIDGHAVLNGQATYQTPAVMTSLCFEGERYTYYAGVEGVNAVENVEELNGDYVVMYGQSVIPDEQAFADGALASEKAEDIADYILEQQPVYLLGGYTVRGNNGTQLTGTIDRVNLVMDAHQGLLEHVDFTSERSSNTFEPERDYERRIQLLNLAPGQHEALLDARNIWGVVAALKHNPRFVIAMTQAHHDRYGSGSPLVTTPISNVDDDEEPLNMGTPLWRPPAVNNPNQTPAMTGTSAVLPSDAGPEDSVFAGATIRDQEPVNPHQSIPLQREGRGLVRVLGPASVGDTLVQAPTPEGADVPDYLVSQANGDDDAPIAGVLQQDVPDSNVHLVQCIFGLAGSGGGGAVAPTTGMVFRGDWVQPNAFVGQDVVVVRTGAGAGTFVALAPIEAGSDAPVDGTTWAIISNQTLLGTWS